MKEVRAPKLDELPVPHDDLEPWCSTACSHPVQWKQLIRLCAAKQVEQQSACVAMGHRYLLGAGPQYDDDLIDAACEFCTKAFSSQWALDMHMRHVHQQRALARCYVQGTRYPTCGGDFRSRPRVVAHMTHGALACGLPWRMGLLQPLTEQELEYADLQDKVDHQCARKKGTVHTAGLRLVVGM